MKIEFYCPRWGSEDINWENFCKKVKAAGYDGIEYAIARTVTEKELDEVWNEVEKNNLKIIAQHYDTYEAEFARHFDLYNGWLEKMKIYSTVKINSQTGKDFFSFEQNKKLIDLAASMNVIHETHRNKFSYAAHVTKQYLDALPNLRITLDTSHWVCVAESYLDDQQEAMELAISRTDHIHARVGYPEGPQVPDPRVAEWQDALNKHLDWWDKVVQHNPSVTITPEFGPFPYLVHEKSQWDMNVWMMELLKKRYQGR